VNIETATTVAIGGTAGELIEWLVIAAVLFVVVTWISTVLPTERDETWLQRLIMWGFVAKLVGTLLRYYMAADLYGTSDAFRYHGRGVVFSSIWRSLSVPGSTAGGEGTAFTEVVTGLVYAIYTPEMRGGFLMFAFIAFLGQLAFYSAFRPWLEGTALKRYAFVILLFPSIVFWPASIGKDALMLLFMGVATLGISKLLRKVGLLGLLLAGLGLYLAAQIRPHIALMLALAATLAFVFLRRGGPTTVRGARRFIPLLAAAVGFAFAWGTFAADFGVSIEGGSDTQDPAAFLERVENQTAQGGSEVVGEGVGGIEDIPSATIKVLFRPLIFEGTSFAILLSALEGTALLVLVVWKLPQVWRNRRMVRRNPLLLLSFFYTGGFIIAFSSILNLGILARQRVQVFPYFLALLVVLGWPHDEAEEPASSESNRRYELLPASRVVSQTQESEDRSWPEDREFRGQSQR
jgi:large-conductance mechanosensitive channel